MDSRVRKWLFVVSIIIILIVSGLIFNGIIRRKTPLVFYVDSEYGSDTNNGTSPLYPWKSLRRVGDEVLIPGDTVLFRRNRTWREKLEIKYSGCPGNPIIFGAYGVGDNPVFLGSVNLGYPDNWTELEENLWATPQDSFPTDVGFILFGNEDPNNVGRKVLDMGSLLRDKDFYYDGNYRRIIVYSTGNPGLKYNGIEAAYSERGYEHIIRLYDQHDIIIENLTLKYFNSHGIGMGSVSRITIRNCIIMYGGGQIQFDSVRFGNGIEFWEDASDCVVEYNLIGQIYDAAVTNQGNGENIQRNIIYRYNVLFRSEYLYEYWNRPEESITKDILFENNIMIGAGYGWSHSQRPDPSGHGLSFHTNKAYTENFTVRNNIFVNAVSAYIFIADKWNGVESLILSENIYFNYSGRLIYFMGTGYNNTEFTVYQRHTGKDAGSVLVNGSEIKTTVIDWTPAMYKKFVTALLG